MARTAFDGTSFLLRWGLALVLVLGSFNPTPYSYLRWVLDEPDQGLPFKALAGVTIVILYIIYLRATFRSIGVVGVLLAFAFLAALAWVLIHLGLITLQETNALTWLALIILATVLAIGVSWSHIRRRITGQSDVDDLEE